MLSNERITELPLTQEEQLEQLNRQRSGVFKILPDYVFLIIMSALPEDERIKFLRVCQRFNTTLRMPIVWQVASSIDPIRNFKRSWRRKIIVDDITTNIQTMGEADDEFLFEHSISGAIREHALADDSVALESKWFHIQDQERRLRMEIGVPEEELSPISTRLIRVKTHLRKLQHIRLNKQMTLACALFLLSGVVMVSAILASGDDSTRECSDQSNRNEYIGCLIKSIEVGIVKNQLLRGMSGVLTGAVWKIGELIVIMGSINFKIIDLTKSATCTKIFNHRDMLALMLAFGLLAGFLVSRSKAQFESDLSACKNNFNLTGLSLYDCLDDAYSQYYYNSYLMPASLFFSYSFSSVIDLTRKAKSSLTRCTSHFFHREAAPTETTPLTLSANQNPPAMMLAQA